MAAMSWIIGGIIALLAGVLVAECALRIGSLGQPERKP
jgi:hypothetical protein